MRLIYTFFLSSLFTGVIAQLPCATGATFQANGAGTNVKLFLQFSSEAEADQIVDSDATGSDVQNITTVNIMGSNSGGGSILVSNVNNLKDAGNGEVRVDGQGAITTDAGNATGLPGVFTGTVEYSDASGTTTCTYTAGVLPVVFADFTARPADGTVRLDWTTATELDNDYFQVERSANGYDFTPLGKVSGSGDSETFLQYDFTDRSPLSGAAYYRLRQVDYDGTESFSRIVSVKNTATITLTAFPTILNGTHELTVELPEATTLELLNISGQILRTYPSVTEGSQTLDMSGLATGMYLLRTTAGTTVRSTKVFIN